MAKKFFLFRWFTKDGWIGKLFEKMPNGEISVQDAVSKAVNAIDNVLVYETEVELITDAISDEAGASADQVISIVKEVRAKLIEIQTLHDVPEALEDVIFSTNDESNDFIHDIVKMAAVAFNDGKISPFEAVGIIARTIEYIKQLKED